MAAKSIAPLFVDFFLSAEFLTMTKSFDVSNADFLDCQRTLNSIKSANPSTTIGHSCEGKHAPTNNFTSHIATQNYHKNDSLFPHAFEFLESCSMEISKFVLLSGEFPSVREIVDEVQTFSPGES